MTCTLIRPIGVLSRCDEALDVGIGILRTPVSMLHDEAARLAEYLIPHLVGSTKGRAVIACGGLHKYLAKRGVCADLAVGHAVHGAAACQAECLHRDPRVYSTQHVERGQFEHLLHGGREVLMPACHRLVGLSRRSEQLDESIRVDVWRGRLTLVP